MALTNVGHDLTVKNSTVPSVGVYSNTVGHDLRVQNNTATDTEGVDVQLNSAGHDAFCRNSTSSAYSGGNTAGHKNTCPT